MLHGLQGLLLQSAHRRTTLDTRSLLHRRRTSTASRHVLWGRPSCPLRSKKRQGAEKNRLHNLNSSRTSRPAFPLSSPTDYARRSITAASTTDFDGFSSCATGPTVLPAAKRKKARCYLLVFYLSEKNLLEF
jgi:hypothetical protein